jgi:hypothetical protein
MQANKPNLADFLGPLNPSVSYVLAVVVDGKEFVIGDVHIQRHTLDTLTFKVVFRQGELKSAIQRLYNLVVATSVGPFLPEQYFIQIIYNHDDGHASIDYATSEAGSTSANYFDTTVNSGSLDLAYQQIDKELQMLTIQLSQDHGSARITISFIYKFKLTFISYTSKKSFVALIRPK